MSDPIPTRLDDYPPSLLLRLDEVCDRFESAWKSGQRPRIEDYLDDTARPGRTLLLRELLGVELEYRRGHGEAPTVEEYRTRFPGGAASLRAVFPDAPSVGQATVAAPASARDVLDVTLEPGQLSANGTLAAADALTLVGIPLDDYEVLEELGSGGMGVVYKAHQRSARRSVALKVIRPDKLQELRPERRREWLARFRREAQAAAQLDHENIIPIYAVGDGDGVPYYVMRCIAGKSLAEMVRDRLPTGSQAAAYVRQVAGAVQAAHEAGIFHRDLKPGNILVDADDRPYVVDFGLARWVEGGTELTQYGDCLGTPPYMPPEQVRNASQVTAQSDVYSLGATLYELLTGRPPFRAAHVVDTLRQVTEDDPLPPRRLNSTVDRDLETITLKCLRKEPERRYASAAQLADDLGRYERKEPIQARPMGRGERLARWARRNPALAAVSGLLAAAALLLAVTTVGLVVQQRDALTKSQRNTARLARDLGLSHCEKGDVPLGLLHLVRALERTLPEDAELQRTIRVNLSCWARQAALLAAAPLQLEVPIQAMAVSPEGKRVLLGGGDSVGRVVELATGKVLLQLRGHTKPIRTVAWNSERQLLLTGSHDGTARLWDAQTGEPRGQVEVGGTVLAVAWGKEGKTFAAAAETEGQAWVWETATRQTLQVFKVGTTIRTLAVHPDGTILLTGHSDGTARLWDTASGQPLRSCKGHAETVCSAAFSPDGRFFVTGSMDETALRWDTATGESGKSIRTSGIVYTLAISPDGRTLLTGGSAKSAQLWDVDSGLALGLPFPHQGDVKAVAFEPNGETILTADGDKVVRVWRTPAWADLGHCLPHDGYVSALAFSPDSALLATGKGSNKPVGPEKKWKLAGEARLFQVPGGTALPFLAAHKSWVSVVDFSPDGKTLATGSTDCTVWLWDVATGQPKLGPFEHDGWISVAAFSPDGRVLLTGNISDNPCARLWDVATGQLRHEWRHGRSVLAGMFHPDGRQVLTASKDGVAQMRDVMTGNLKVEVQHGSPILAAALSGNGSQFVTAGVDGAARLWETDPQGPLWVLWHQKAVLAAAFSPDGRFVLTGSADRTARVWNAATGVPVGQPLTHEDDVQVVAFSPDGATVLTGSRDNTARFWDRDTGLPLGPPLRHAWSREREEASTVPGEPPPRLQKGVQAAVFSLDGNWAATASRDGMVRLWRTPARVEGDAARLLLWLQTGSGIELDPYGVPRELNALAWQERLQKLQHMGGAQLP